LFGSQNKRLAELCFASMAEKAEKIFMPRRQAEVTECESVTSKSQLCNILKKNIFSDFKLYPGFFD
jgi:hypothetical protein